MNPPLIFNTITVADGIAMGHEGMRYSLPSREIIADSIETVMGAERLDGIVAIGGCDKNMPGCMIAIGRMNFPAVFVYGGTIQPGKNHGKDIAIISAFEAVGQHNRHEIDVRNYIALNVMRVRALVPVVVCIQLIRWPQQLRLWGWLFPVMHQHLL